VDHAKAFFFPSLLPPKKLKFFKIFCHIKFLDACMWY
jgi:hypothetical protein